MQHAREILDLELNGMVSVLNPADNDDVRELGRALNHLGYFTPDPRTGFIPAPPEGILFEALRKFQREHGLFGSGTIMPGDATEKALNRALKENEKSARGYVWRTVHDGKVRSSHAAREGKLFYWNEHLPGGHPGEDYNCRCWAEPYFAAYQPPVQNKLSPPPIPQKKELTVKQRALLASTQAVLIGAQIANFPLTRKLLLHYLDKTGTPLQLTLTEMRMFDQNILLNQKRFEDSMVKGEVEGKYHEFHDKLLQMKDGETIVLNKSDETGGDSWDNTIKTTLTGLLLDPNDQKFSTGSIQVHSSGAFLGTRRGNIVRIDGSVENTIHDIYNFNDVTLTDKILVGFREMAEEGLAKPFDVYGTKIRTVTAILEIKNGKIIANANSWKWEDHDR